MMVQHSSWGMGRVLPWLQLAQCLQVVQLVGLVLLLAQCKLNHNNQHLVTSHLDSKSISPH